MMPPWKSALIGVSSGFLGACLTLLIQGCGGSSEQERTNTQSDFDVLQERIVERGADWRLGSVGRDTARLLLELEMLEVWERIADRCDPVGAR